MKSLFKQMSTYGLGGFLSKAANFLLLPVYTRVLSPAEYGTVELAYVFGNIIGVLYGFLVSSAFIRFYYDTKDEREKSKYLGTTLWFVMGCAVVFSAIILLSGETASKILFGSPDDAYYLQLITLSILLHSVSMVFYNELMVKKLAKRYVTFNLITLVITLILKVYFVVFLRMSVEGVLLAQLIGRAVEFIALGVYYIKRKELLFFSPTYLKPMLVYAFPLVLLQITYFLLNLGDRYLIRLFGDTADLGVYSLGFRFASLIPLFAIVPLKAFGPHIFSLVDNPVKCKNEIKNFLRLYTGGIFTIVIVIALFSEEVIKIMADKEYWDAYRVVFLLCISQALWGMVTVVVYGFHIVKKSWLSSLIIGASSALSIVLYYAFISQYGMMGGAFSKALAYLLMLFACFFFLRKQYYINFNYGLIFSTIGVAVLIYYLTYIFNLSVVLSLAMKVFLLSLFIIYLFASGTITRREREKAVLFIKSRFRGVKG